jgi:hypothetical protein
MPSEGGSYGEMMSIRAINHSSIVLRVPTRFHVDLRDLVVTQMPIDSGE